MSAGKVVLEYSPRGRDVVKEVEPMTRDVADLWGREGHSRARELWGEGGREGWGGRGHIDFQLMRHSALTNEVRSRGDKTRLSLGAARLDMMYGVHLLEWPHPQHAYL